MFFYMGKLDSRARIADALLMTTVEGGRGEQRHVLPARQSRIGSSSANRIDSEGTIIVLPGREMSKKEWMVKEENGEENGEERMIKEVRK